MGPDCSSDWQSFLICYVQTKIPHGMIIYPTWPTHMYIYIYKNRYIDIDIDVHIFSRAGSTSLMASGSWSCLQECIESFGFLGDAIGGCIWSGLEEEIACFRRVYPWRWYFYMFGCECCVVSVGAFGQDILAWYPQWLVSGVWSFCPQDHPGNGHKCCSWGYQEWNGIRRLAVSHVQQPPKADRQN